MIEAHPEWDITASVRNSDKGGQVAAICPSVKLVYGDLDAVDMIEEEASKADIVYRKHVVLMPAKEIDTSRLCKL